MLAACALISLALCGQTAPSPARAAEAAALWERGERTAALELLVEHWDALPEGQRDPALRRQLVEWEFAVHRFGAALGHMGTADFGGRRGEALYHLSRFEEALLHLGSSSPAEVLYRLDGLEALGRLEEHDAELARALERWPDEPRFWTLDGIRLARGADLSGAIERFRAALAANPIDAAACFGLGQALVRSGAREEGLRVLAEHRRQVPLIDELGFAEHSLDLAPLHAPNHAAVGDAERALGRFDRAEAAYARALQLAEGAQVVPIALRAARLLAEDRGDLESALAVLRASAAQVSDPRLHVRAGDLLLEAGRAAEAAAAYETALALAPGDAQIQERVQRARRAAEPPR